MLPDELFKNDAFFLRCPTHQIQKHFGLFPGQSVLVGVKTLVQTNTTAVASNRLQRILSRQDFYIRPECPCRYTELSGKIRHILLSPSDHDFHDLFPAFRCGHDSVHLLSLDRVCMIKVK